jgi:hypothetical protein
MGSNEDSLLRDAGEKTLASATRGGSWAHLDQSRGLARWRNLRATSGVGASIPILPFFLGGGVALHERLVGISHAMRNELVEEFIVDLNKPALFLRKKEPGSDPSMTC